MTTATTTNTTNTTNTTEAQTTRPDPAAPPKHEPASSNGHAEGYGAEQRDQEQRNGQAPALDTVQAPADLFAAPTPQEIAQRLAALDSIGRDLPARRTQAEEIWAAMLSGDDARRDAALIALARAPQDTRAVIAQRSGEAAAVYYATPEGRDELADWRALDGEPFHDDAGDYYSAEEEAQFRAARTA